MLNHNWACVNREKHGMPYVHITRRPELCQNHERLLCGSGFYLDLEDVGKIMRCKSEGVLGRRNGFDKEF